MPELTIDKHVPVPIRTKGKYPDQERGSAPSPCYLRIAEQMEIGDSILCRDYDQANCVLRGLRYLGRMGLTKHLEHEGGRCRVWRSEFPDSWRQNA